MKRPFRINKITTNASICIMQCMPLLVCNRDFPLEGHHLWRNGRAPGHRTHPRTGPGQNSAWTSLRYQARQAGQEEARPGPGRDQHQPARVTAGPSRLAKKSWSGPSSPRSGPNQGRAGPARTGWGKPVRQGQAIPDHGPPSKGKGFARPGAWASQAHPEPARATMDCTWARAYQAGQRRRHDRSGSARPSKAQSGPASVT